MANPTMVDEEGGVRTNFWSCPVQFIPSSVWEFLKCQSFFEKHPSAKFPGIDEVSPRYLAAERIYDTEFNSCLMEA